MAVLCCRVTQTHNFILPITRICALKLQRVHANNDVLHSGSVVYGFSSSSTWQYNPTLPPPRTGLNGHKRGSSCRTYTHSLGVVTPNVIIIYCRYGIGAPIGRGTQAHTFRRYVGYVGYECFLPQARLCTPPMWCVSGSDSVIHRDRPDRPAQ